jgi:hypothetical protein
VAGLEWPDDGEGLLDRARDEARLRDARLDVVRVRPMTGIVARRASSPARLRRSAVGHLAVDHESGSAGPGIEELVTTGRAGIALAARCVGAELLVVRQDGGDRGRWDDDSAATQVLRHARGPVLLAEGRRPVVPRRRLELVG